MSQDKSTTPATDQMGDGDGDKKGRNKSKDQLLCSSCDSCRTRKTKCNGKRPCEACVISYIRKNKIANADEVDVKKIKCVYSPAKRRGPPPKRTLERELEAREQERKQRREEEHPIVGMGRNPEEVLPVPNLNLNNASFLNLVGALLNPNPPPMQGCISKVICTPAPMPPPPDPATLQQTLLSTLGSALGITQGVGVTQGLGGVASANTGYNIMNNVPSAASQQLAYLQQLQQQFQLQQLQQNLQQQLQQQPITQQQGQTARGAESSISSSLEDNNTQALQNEVGRLRRRVEELEAENADLRQKLDAL